MKLVLSCRLCTPVSISIIYIIRRRVLSRVFVAYVSTVDGRVKKEKVFSYMKNLVLIDCLAMTLAFLDIE